ncbi:hypothetical protein I4U23_013468 [Adineta vaga]|nr:hypothetical protein I4U23_013468 [Adineta vaga]
MENIINNCCKNDSCVNKETQLRLARLREELLTNFNSLLIDRIRFLEQTISQLSLKSSSSSTSTVPLTDKRPPPEIIITDRLTLPTTLRRSTSATADLQTLDDLNFIEEDINARSCLSNADLSSDNEKRKWFLSLTTPLGTKDQIIFTSNSDYLSPPNIHRPWARSANDIPSSTMLNNDKGRLDSRRFACDVDDNDVRAFKAMVYMEQARKQHARPFTRLRQALGISTSKSAGNFAAYNSKK